MFHDLPRSTYGGGYYAAPSFPDTPIYDSLVAERVPLRSPRSECLPPMTAATATSPALPAALPALPAAPSQPNPSYGYPQPMAAQQQGYAPMRPAHLQHAPAPYIPQQPTGMRGGYQAPQPQQQRPAPSTGYESMRPASPRPAPTPSPYEDPYNRPYQGRGY